jgi:hypothetical protein
MRILRDVEAGGSNALTPTRRTNEQALAHHALGLFCFGLPRKSRRVLFQTGIRISLLAIQHRPILPLRQLS